MQNRAMGLVQSAAGADLVAVISRAAAVDQALLVSRRRWWAQRLR